jgi:hypothetical protein
MFALSARANFEVLIVILEWARLRPLAAAHCIACRAVEAVCPVLVPVPIDSLHGQFHFISSVAAPVRTCWWNTST